eukprot:symbB.v1.2.037854.t1/scaffold5710.1/size24330/2
MSSSRFDDSMTGEPLHRAGDWRLGDVLDNACISNFTDCIFFGVHTWLLLPSLAAAALNCPTLPLVSSGGVHYHGAGTTERIRSASKAMPAVVDFKLPSFVFGSHGCHRSFYSAELHSDS